MKKILLIPILFLFSCDEKLPDLPNVIRNNCVDLEYNNTCVEVSKRGVGRKSCEEDEKCNLICEPLDKAIHKQCCFDNDAYSVFLRKKLADEQSNANKQ